MLGYIDSPGDQSVGMWDTNGSVGMEEAPSGSGHLGAAGWILLLIGLKAFTESNFITTDLAEVKISLLNVFSVFLMAGAGKLAFAFITDWMVKNGVALPGQVELQRAL